jgi:hypothetical protein
VLTPTTVMQRTFGVTEIDDPLSHIYEQKLKGVGLRQPFVITNWRTVMRMPTAAT